MSYILYCQIGNERDSLEFGIRPVDQLIAKYVSWNNNTETRNIINTDIETTWLTVGIFPREILQ
jgi:hypothetical protein